MHLVTPILITPNRAPSVPPDCQIHEGESRYQKDSIQITTTGNAAHSRTVTRPSCTQRMEGQQDPALALCGGDWRRCQRKLLQRHDGRDARDAGWCRWTFCRNSSTSCTASCQSEEGQEETEGLIRTRRGEHLALPARTENRGDRLRHSSRPPCSHRDHRHDVADERTECRSGNREAEMLNEQVQFYLFDSTCVSSHRKTLLVVDLNASSHIVFTGHDSGTSLGSVLLQFYSLRVVYT